MTQKPAKPTEADVGASLMAWYFDCMRQFPDGLVSQAQAAKMLGIGRMAISRLVGRGALRAVYYPKPPDIQGFDVVGDDPTWLKLMGFFGSWVTKINFPEACFVSFGDVVELWLRGDAVHRCQLEWRELILGIRSQRDDVREQGAFISAQQDADQHERLQRSFKDRQMVLAGKKLYLHDELLDWFAKKAKGLGLTRNQLVFWSMEQWRTVIDGTATSSELRLPNEQEVNRIHSQDRSASFEQCRGEVNGWIRLYDEFGGDLGTWGSTGMNFDGSVD